MSTYRYCLQLYVRGAAYLACHVKTSQTTILQRNDSSRIHHSRTGMSLLTEPNRSTLSNGDEGSCSNTGSHQHMSRESIICDNPGELPTLRSPHHVAAEA